MATTINNPTKPLPMAPHPSVPTTPIPDYLHIGKSGQDALWAGFVVFLVTTLIIMTLAVRLQVKHRALHLLTMLATTIATLSYYAMATGSGWTYVFFGWYQVQGVETQVFRQVFWARLVAGALATPLLLLDLSLLAGLPWLEVLALLVADQAVILTALFSGLHRHPHGGAKWGWYAFSCLFLLYIFSLLLFKGRKSAKHQHAEACGLYTKLSIYTVIVWLVYPIILALGQGTGCISPDGEAIALTVLDIFAIAVFGIWLLYVHKHEDDEVHCARLPESWTEPRGKRTGLIHLPGGDED